MRTTFSPTRCMEAEMVAESHGERAFASFPAASPPHAAVESFIIAGDVPCGAIDGCFF
jgi:hypothetical protein